jgi:hypothetical protein
MEAPKKTDTTPNPKCFLESSNLGWKSYNKIISHEMSGAVAYASHQVINATRTAFLAIFNFVLCQF